MPGRGRGRFHAPERDGSHRLGGSRGGDCRAGPRCAGEKEQPHLFGAPKPNPFPHLGDVTADLAARDAFTAALEAADAEGHSDSFINGAVRDYDKLLRLELGNYPEAGKPIDPSGDGPLGPREPIQ